jgi:hypothetical protein
MHFAIPFGDDIGFAPVFRDQQLYEKVWDLKPEESNQVGHFLTAVSVSYDMGYAFFEWVTGESWVVRSDLMVIIGHEKVSDEGFAPKVFWDQYWSTTEDDIQRWHAAVEADRRGDSATRDQELWAILNFGPDIEFEGADPKRLGNSLQDLRLSLKGYRFSRWVWGNASTSPEEAAIWLRRNLQAR